MAHSAPTALNLPHNAFVHPEALREKKNAQKKCVCMCPYVRLRVRGCACICDDVKICPCMGVGRQTVWFEFSCATHTNVHFSSVTCIQTYTTTEKMLDVALVETQPE